MTVMASSLLGLFCFQSSTVFASESATESNCSSSSSSEGHPQSAWPLSCVWWQQSHLHHLEGQWPAPKRQWWCRNLPCLLLGFLWVLPPLQWSPRNTEAPWKSLSSVASSCSLSVNLHVLSMKSSSVCSASSCVLNPSSSNQSTSCSSRMDPSTAELKSSASSSESSLKLFSSKQRRGSKLHHATTSWACSATISWDDYQWLGLWWWWMRWRR